MKRSWFAALGIVAEAAALGAQAPAATTAQPDARFRVQIELVRVDAVVRDANGQFVPDLTKDDFAVLEDGVQQDLSSVTLVHGGRVMNLLAPRPAAVEGVILPSTRKQNDASGRVFVFIIDDMHLDVHKTPVVRDLFKRIAKNLLHEGDLFGMVSTGASAIAVDLTYDRKQFDEAVNHITGRGLSPLEIIEGQSGADGPVEVRHRAHVAFTTVTNLLADLEKVHDRRKLMVYVSNGYDFTPFQQARFGNDTSSPFAQNQAQGSANREAAHAALADGTAVPRHDPNAQLGNSNEEFGDAALAQDLEALTEAANRANATIFTVDPRGVVAAADLGDNIDPREYQRYVGKTQDTLRVIAAETGGTASVNQSDFDSALKRIDAEASDYYMLGYYANHQNAGRRVHHIEIKTRRPGLAVRTRTTYVEKGPDGNQVPGNKPPPPSAK